MNTSNRLQCSAFLIVALCFPICGCFPSGERKTGAEILRSVGRNAKAIPVISASVEPDVSPSGQDVKVLIIACLGSGMQDWTNRIATNRLVIFTEPMQEILVDNAIQQMLRRSDSNRTVFMFKASPVLALAQDADGKQFSVEYLKAQNVRIELVK